MTAQPAAAPVADLTPYVLDARWRAVLAAIARHDAWLTGLLTTATRPLTATAQGTVVLAVASPLAHAILAQPAVRAAVAAAIHQVCGWPANVTVTREHRLEDDDDDDD